MKEGGGKEVERKAGRVEGREQGREGGREAVHVSGRGGGLWAQLRATKTEGGEGGEGKAKGLFGRTLVAPRWMDVGVHGWGKQGEQQEVGERRPSGLEREKTAQSRMHTRARAGAGAKGRRRRRGFDTARKRRRRRPRQPGRAPGVQGGAGGREPNRPANPSPSMRLAATRALP